ncbi:hypothetical protein KIS4809_1035 [Bacillus sp. ZZV12-4809]|nr:hypothetical protein KIS4809_1035 [Bacillus sp. ZZV12-4809]
MPLDRQFLSGHKQAALMEFSTRSIYHSIATIFSLEFTYSGLDKKSMVSWLIFFLSSACSRKI